MREEDLDLSDDEISSGNEQENFGSDRESDNEESADESAEGGQFVVFRNNFLATLRLMFPHLFEFSIYLTYTLAPPEICSIRK